MRAFIFLSLTILITFLVHLTQTRRFESACESCIQFPPSSINVILSVVLWRGGKSRKAATKLPQSRAKASKRHLDEDDDDDDDEDERPVTKPTRSSIKSQSKPKPGQLIPWGSTSKKGKGKRKGQGLAALTGSIGNIKEALEGIAKKGQLAYKDVYRRAKILKSSAFEGMLLRATWPGNDPVPQEILTEIIKHSIPAFKYSQSVRFIIVQS